MQWKQPLSLSPCNYLRQVNEVNGGDTVFVRCVCLCVYVCECSRPVNKTSLKRLKLRTSNLTSMFPWTVRTRPLKIFRKGAGSCDPLKFWALNANSSKTVTAIDFEVNQHVPRYSPDMTPLKLLLCKNSLGRDMHSHERLVVISMLLCCYMLCFYCRFLIAFFCVSALNWHSVGLKLFRRNKSTSGKRHKIIKIISIV